MKALLIAALSFVMGSATLAHADVEIPKEAEAQSAEDVRFYVDAYRAGEILLINSQISWYELNKLAFEGGRVASAPLGNEGLGAAATGVLVVVDGLIGKQWLQRVGAPSSKVVAAAWAAAGGAGLISRTAKGVWEGFKALGKQANPWKKAGATLGIGAVALAQYEGYFIVNMSEAQYKATLKAFDVKIASLKKSREAIADQYVPVGL